LVENLCITSGRIVACVRESREPLRLPHRNADKSNAAASEALGPVIRYGNITRLVRLADILDVSHVKMPLSADSRCRIIAALVDLLWQCGDLTDQRAALQAVLHRQRVGPAVLGADHTVAVPHARCPAVTRPVLAVARLEEPVTFNRSDGPVVQMVVLLLVPEQSLTLQTEALARIDDVVRCPEHREALLAARTADEVVTVFSSAGSAQPETSSDNGDSAQPMRRVS